LENPKPVDEIELLLDGFKVFEFQNTEHGSGIMVDASDMNCEKLVFCVQKIVNA